MRISILKVAGTNETFYLNCLHIELASHYYQHIVDDQQKSLYFHRSEWLVPIQCSQIPK